MEIQPLDRGTTRASSPTIPDVPAMLERIRRWRDAYLRWGRDTLGFAVYLFYRPGSRMGVAGRCADAQPRMENGALIKS